MENPMTLDKSLKVKAGAVKDRNVLTRAERLTQRVTQGTWTEESTVLGMAKTRVKKLAMKKKKKVKAAEEETKKK
jgi:small basic protein (TIGR04137 family)